MQDVAAQREAEQLGSDEGAAFLRAVLTEGGNGFVISSLKVACSWFGDGVVGDGGAQQEDERVVAWVALPALDEVPDEQFPTPIHCCTSAGPVPAGPWSRPRRIGRPSSRSSASPSRHRYRPGRQPRGLSSAHTRAPRRRCARRRGSCAGFPPSAGLLRRACGRLLLWPSARRVSSLCIRLHSTLANA